MATKVKITCPMCGKERDIYNSQKRHYVHNACFRCKNIYSNQTRFSHYKWYYINLYIKIIGPFKSSREAKLNKPNHNSNYRLVSHNGLTNEVKDERGKSVTPSETRKIKEKSNAR